MHGPILTRGKDIHEFFTRASAKHVPVTTDTPCCRWFDDPKKTEAAIIPGISFVPSKWMAAWHESTRTAALARTPEQPRASACVGIATPHTHYTQSLCRVVSVSSCPRYSHTMETQMGSWSWPLFHFQLQIIDEVLATDYLHGSGWDWRQDALLNCLAA